MKTAIVSVGTELLFGQIVNTNAVYLSQQMNLLGMDVLYHFTVGDNPKRLADTLRQALKDCDLILTSGGLGPTQDDLTKETVAEVLHDQLVEHPHCMERLLAEYKKIGRPMSENNRKQAFMPSRAQVFDNDGGTAPGFALIEGEKMIICMPGPPREMTAMFEEKIKPYFLKRSNAAIYYRIIREFGIGESQLETNLLPLIDGQTDPTIATYAKEGESTLRIASKRATMEEARQAVNDMIKRVDEIIGDSIYSYDNEELAAVVGRKLLEQQITVSSAESCTGGLFAARLIDIPGISAVFDRGLVTYSNKAKEEELGVSGKTLKSYGAVSRETAVEMAEGLHRASGSRLCISVTGVAGPDGGTEEKPVGLVYVAILLDGTLTCREFRQWPVNRSWNRNYTVLQMLFMIYKLIDKM